MLRKQSAVYTPTGLSKGAEGEESPGGARGTCCWRQKAGKPAAKFICKGRFTAQHQTGESLPLSEDQIFFLLVPFLAIAVPLPRPGHALVLWVFFGPFVNGSHPPQSKELPGTHGATVRTYAVRWERAAGRRGTCRQNQAALFFCISSPFQLLYL